uniref:Uncharacterized protein n=1 Tax=Meloidogyne incognita TaxID=6306 RepID=A0A914LD95_MELIC
MQDFIYALFDFAETNNSNTNLSDAALRSLVSLGVKKPKMFINAVHTFLLDNGKKMNEKDKAFAFRCLTNVFNQVDVVDVCDEQQILLIANLSTQEMSMAKDVENGLAHAAKDVFVSLVGKSDKFVNHVVDSLLHKFQPGSTSPPHRFIILTLSEIAQKNPDGFLPFLHDILARTDALLPHLKNDQIKSAFCQALCSFAESVKEFIWTQKRQNNEMEVKSDECVAVDESEISESYADQFETAYDVIINWTTSSKDHKCRADAAECIGKLCLMIDRERILKDLKRLDAIFRSLHKKALNPEEQLAITMGISNFLQASCIEESIPIEHYINDLFEMLFPHVCLPADQIVDDPSLPNLLQIKLRNEVFRCFQVSSCRTADKEIYFLLHKMQSQSEIVKLGAINLFRHLLNSADDQMKENRSLITMGMKPFLNDEQLSIRVKMNLCQLCIALSDNEYVQSDEGGEHVIQFLLANLVVNRSDLNVKQRSSVQQQQLLQASSDASLITQLSAQCAQALYTISNTSKVACELLWPKLFEYVCVEQYSLVITDIFKCLRVLCGRIKQSCNKLDIYDFEANSKLPGPFQLICRLIVFMNGAPQNAQLNARAKESINLFGELFFWLNNKFCETDSPFPKIIGHLLESLQKEFSSNCPSNEDKNDYFGKEILFSRVERWQAVILDLLCSLINAVEDQSWRQNLASAQAKQLSTLFTSASDSFQSSQDKAFLMRCLGCTLARIEDPTFIKEHLYFLFRHTQHSSIIERVGCAIATGHCASVLDHADLVLTELENVSKWEHMKEGKKQSGGSSAGFLSFIKDSLPYGRSVDAEILNLRATIVLSFGYVCFYCPTEGLVLRLQNTVLPFLRQYTANSKESSLREAHLETLNLIALSVHPNRLRDYRFESRYECLSYIKEYVNDEKSFDTVTTLIRLRACKATASLVLLEPPLSENEFIDIINVLIPNIFPINRERGGLKATGEDDSSTVMEATIIQCRNAIANMVKMRPCVRPTVGELLKLFYQYYGSERDHERARAVDFTVLVLQVYSEKASDVTLGIAKEFSSLSWIIARLCPRLCDSLSFVRLQSLRAIWFAFKLSLLHRGHSPSDVEMVDSSLFNIDKFIELYFGGTQEGRLDSNKCSGAILAISKEVESRLPQSQVQNYIHMLFKMLSDKQGNVSSAAAQLLTNILSYRANLLQKEAEVLLINMLDHLARTRQEKIQTYTELLNGFVLFSGHHLHLAVQVLLRQTLPYNQTLSEVWEMMSRTHFTSIIDFLFERVWIDNSSSSSKTPDLIVEQEEKNIVIVENKEKELNNFEENEKEKGGGKLITTPFNSSHFEIINIGGGSVIKIVSDDTCALVAAIAEVVKKGEPEDELIKRVPRIISALLILLVSLIDTQYSNVQKNSNVDLSGTTSSSQSGIGGKKEVKTKPIIPIVTSELTRSIETPAKLVAEAIRTFLVRINAENVIEKMNSERVWSNIVSPQHYINALSSFCCALFNFRPQFIGDLMRLECECLRGGENVLKNVCDAERIVAVSILSSLITSCPHKNGEFDSSLFCDVFGTLEGALKDQLLTVRKMALHGIGQISHLKGPDAEELILCFSSRSVEAALAGLDDYWDRQDQLATESIASLDSLVGISQPKLILNVLPQLLLKIRPCFEKENELLRSSAFSLFAGLGSSVGNYDIFKESLHSNIISILLHLNDKEENVKLSCAKVLSTCIPLLNSDHATTLVENEFVNGRLPANFSDFLRQFGLILSISFPDRLNNYALDCNNFFRSASFHIRSNAALLMGFMLTALTPELRATLSTDLIFSGLMQLMKDPEEQVRLNTLFAISLLYEFA